MASGQSRRDARRPQHRIFVWIRREGFDRPAVVWMLGNFAHRRGYLPLPYFPRALEVRLRYGIQLRRELVTRDSQQRISEFINGVVLPWNRAVASGVGRFQFNRVVDLLARLHVIGDFLPITNGPISSFIERQAGVNPVAMILQQPFNAVVLAALFAGGQGDDNISGGDEAFLFVANQV